MGALAVIALVCAVVRQPSALAQNTTPTWLSCPNELAIEPLLDRERDPHRIRDFAPSAGARPSAELYSHARFATLAYDLYGAFDAGRDPRAAFVQPGLQLVSLIYGDPGPNTERRPPGKSTRTLYGFIADETATGRRCVAPAFPRARRAHNVCHPGRPRLWIHFRSVAGDIYRGQQLASMRATPICRPSIRADPLAL